MVELGRVKGLEAATDDGDKTLEVTATTADPEEIEGSQASPAGFDGQPLNDDLAVAVKAPGQGQWVIVGYLDLKNGSGVAQGESRQYSRDADGNIVFSIHLKADGTAEIGGSADTAVGFSTLNTEFEKLKTEIMTNLAAIATGLAAVPYTYVPTALTASLAGAEKATVKLP